MITDGNATDSDNGSFERLIQEQKSKHCRFFSIGIGENVDLNMLKELTVDGVVFGESKEDFKDAFAWLSHSLSSVSSSNPGDRVVLYPPHGQITIFA